MYLCGILLSLAAKQNVRSINMSHPYDVKFFCLVVETYTTMVYPTAVWGATRRVQWVRNENSVFRWFIVVVCDHNITIDSRCVRQNTTTLYKGVRSQKIDIYGPRSLIGQLPELMYTYTISKTNELSFNTHLVIIAHYAHMYPVTLCFPL